MHREREREGSISEDTLGFVLINDNDEFINRFAQHDDTSILTVRENVTEELLK